MDKIQLRVKLRLRDLLTVDLPWTINDAIRSDRQDGFLHPSTHLAAPLRHAQLDIAGAPKKERPFADQMTLHIGTLVHEWFHDVLRRRGVPYMAEVNLGPWMPAGWNGTADAVVWEPELKAFILVDFKTTRGEAIRYRIQSGANEEHILQTSVYWHALRKMGLPLAKVIGVFYVPKNAVRGMEANPLLVDFEPLALKGLLGRMTRRKNAVDRYVAGLPKPNPRPLLDEEFLTDDLADAAPMEQRLFPDRSTGDQVLKLVPHWTAAYCPYEPPLCSCSELRAMTIGRYDDLGEYTPRRGYESIEPLVRP